MKTFCLRIFVSKKMIKLINVHAIKLIFLRLIRNLKIISARDALILLNKLISVFWKKVKIILNQFAI